MEHEFDLAIIGGGIAGLAAGTIASESGLKTILVRKGQGSTSYSSGAIDILGNLVESLFPLSPLDTLSTTGVIRSTHPYVILGISEDNREVETELIVQRVRDSTKWLQKGLDGSCAEFTGALDRTMEAITVLGTTKPTCFVQKTMDMGNLREHHDESILLFVDLLGHPDFNGRLAARTFAEFQRYEDKPVKKVSSCSITIAPFGKPYNISSVEIARHLDHSGLPSEALSELRTNIENTGATHVALPPVMGIEYATTVLQEIADLGVHPFEVLSFPPSVPGMRLQQSLDDMYLESGGQMHIGTEVVGFDSADDRVSRIIAKSPHRQLEISATATILASGKFIGGGIRGAESGFRESIFNLDTVDLNYNPTDDLRPQKLTDRINVSYEGHAAFSVGVPVDRYFRPINYDSQVVYENLFAAGSILAGYNYPVEKSGLGVGLTTGYTAGLNAMRYIKEEL
ncbi:MAG: anaerobic glycerol-3-phosphate dehydrogenase subunit B [Candidatus Lokiarchaeota archaeon]|nr:anaerobic glycerol-3-phosphate dehydrogenase subunit B [Candidatus Lokiarchaeota archaeon]